MQDEALFRVEEAIKSIKNGEMIIIMDDEDRENEGDLVLAGVFSTPEKINFMAQEARGLICVSITQEIAKALDLPPMVGNNDSNHETAFTISIDARSAKTGISAYERDLTIRLMCKPDAKPSDFVRPGHIFPLTAKEGGVLERTGHTEASVDICKLAGLSPIGVICEIMKKDGLMARRGDRFLSEFAKKHHLNILYVSDLIQYRLRFEQLIRIVSDEKSNFFGFCVRKILVSDYLQRSHVVFAFKEAKVPCVKFHIVRQDLLLLVDKPQYDSLINSIAFLQKEGGYLVFLATQDNRDIKDLGIGAQILKALGVENFRLLSRSQVDEGEYAVLSGFNLKILDKISV
ncbi:MAG: bifunctional 3,4-dihydroxy-2-butanone 4-phosphate synthase/GTP cyclohydrolase II [Helicobacter sp.]|nr:bifunctional 3,4-dihydroxy-2-butanone 4-phosphate synthase/GTP cyclohydrolase II [Helicobacter sp.]